MVSGEHDPTVRVAVAVPVDRSDVELVADVLFGAGASAVLERRTDDGGLELVADLDLTALESLGRPVRVMDAAEADPSGAPAAALETHRCGRRVVVRALHGPDDGSALLSPSDSDVQVVVDAGRAFGSGSHASTRLCLAALEPLATRATTVLDVGCGTGVLGVTAALLGPAAVRAIDIDAEAVEVTRLVAGRNGVESRVAVDSTALGRIEDRYDLVLANLLIPIVESLGEDLVRVVAPGGSLVVGGLLLAHRTRALRALEPLVLETQYVEGDWVAIVLSAR